MENQTLYFAYGSNLSPTQMGDRCPGSQFVGVGLLHGWRWIINERGYANIIIFSSSSPGLSRGNNSLTHIQPENIINTGAEKTEDDAIVWGLLYRLSPSDEGALDDYEGVPWAYTKENLPVEFWPQGESVGKKETGKVVMALVYLDRLRTGEGEPRKEYVDRMRRGLTEAMGLGVPAAWAGRIGCLVALEDEDEVDHAHVRGKIFRGLFRRRDIR
ncbi:hypothetical protein MMC20_007448 [Loxospora ochrophaea]|nr:hypothetical protein [Loxospora ochrophaea]